MGPSHRTNPDGTVLKKRPSRTQKALAALLALLTMASLALSITATLSSRWYQQDVALGVQGASTFAQTLSLRIGTRGGWCVLGLPANIQPAEVAPGAQDDCRRVDICSIANDAACTAVKAARGLMIANDASIGLTLLLILLLFRFRGICLYLLALFFALVSVVISVAVIVYFRVIPGILEPRIPDLVNRIAGDAARALQVSPGRDTYFYPYNLLLAVLAMMALTFLVLFGMMLARCCCGGAGRRRRSRKHSADPYATSVPTTTTTTTAAAIDPVTGRPYRTNRSWNPFANRRSRRTPSQQPMTYPNNHSELRV